MTPRPARRVPPVAGLLLTGGASTRLGRDKATAPLPTGETCAQRAAKTLSAAAALSLEVGRGVSGLPAVAEARPCGGPLAALVEGWDALVRCGWAGPVLVLACDMPLLRPELLALLGTWPTSQSVVPVVRGRPQWLCARYDAGTASGWSAAYAGGTRALRRAVDLSRVAWLGPDEWGSVASAEDFLDADTPRAMTAVSALLRGSDARPAPCATS